MFRSETMHYYELLFARDHSYELLDALARLAVVEFVNLNSHATKASLHNVSQIKKCEDMLSKLGTVSTLTYCSPSSAALTYRFASGARRPALSSSLQFPPPTN
jgi:hypothetical protein